MGNAKMQTSASPFNPPMAKLLISGLIALLLTGTGCLGGGGSGGGGGNGTGNGNDTDAGDEGGGDSASIAAPADLEAWSTEDGVELEWTATDGADGYHVYFGKEADIHPDTAASYETQVAADGTTAIFDELTPATRYYFVVTSVSADEESDASNEVHGHIPEILATYRLNDTGIDQCSSPSGGWTDCPLPDYPGQDGDSGRDAQAREGELTKAGTGAAGFDFTKIGTEGEALPADAAHVDDGGPWACTRDNHTGLIWEVKRTDGGLRDSAHTYSWYQPDDSINAEHAGLEDGGDCIDARCDTAGYVDAVNEKGLCGAQDWHLPTRNELLSIVHYGRIEPAIDTEFFPNTQYPEDLQPVLYVTATSRYPGPNTAYAVGFRWGRMDDRGKGLPDHVRLVRGNDADPILVDDDADGCHAEIPTSTPTEDFILEGDEATHVPTGLVWQRCVRGMEWDADAQTCTGDTSIGFTTWQAALDYAAGLAEWRLPNIKELASIREDRCWAVNPEVFPDFPGGRFMTSSTLYDPSSDFHGYWDISNDRHNIRFTSTGSPLSVVDHVWLVKDAD